MSKLGPYTSTINLAGDPCNQKNTTFSSVVDRYFEQVEVGYDYFKSLTSSDPVETSAQLFVGLNDKLKTEEPEFAAFWVEKYKTAHDAVKKRVTKILEENNVFFRDFNESMGALANYVWNADRSTKHCADINLEYSDIPYPFNSTHNYILDRNSIECSLQLYKQTGSLFNQNVCNIVEPKKINSIGKTELWSNTQLSTDAHGGNLAVDHMHYKRMKKLSADLLSIVEEDLKELSKVYRLLKNQKFNSEIKRESIGIKIEGAMQNITILKREIESHPSKTKSNSVLS